MKQIYELPSSLYNEWQTTSPLYETADEFMRRIGFKSCVYVVSGRYWEMDDKDHTLFVLKWT